MVKNFDDKESDSIISRNGWKEVYNDDLYQGRMVLAGLEESRGEVITLLVLGDGPEAYIRQAKYLLQFNEAYNIIGSELLEGGLNIYACSRLLHLSELWLIPLTELKRLPSELRPKPSDVARALRCVAEGLSRRLTLPLVLASLVLGHAKPLKGRIYRLLGRLI